MASISSRRVANSLQWTLSFTTRSRTVGFSYIQSDHPQNRFTRATQPSAHRSFSSAFTRSQQANAAEATKPAAARSAFVPMTPAREPMPSTTRTQAANPPIEPIREYTNGLSDNLPLSDSNSPEQVDWTRSFQGLSSEAFSPEAAEILMQPISEDDIEIKPEGIVYLPEIKYRRILNRAFGPGGWGLAPRGETIVTSKSVTREYALVVGGRLVSIARGEQAYFDPEGIPTATEGCKSNALMRCCKDLGVASELWDPRFIRKFLAKNSKEVWVEHQTTKRRKKISLRKDDEVRYPFKEVRAGTT